MTRSKFRGHDIFWDGLHWRFLDTKSKTQDTNQDRPCGFCGSHDTAEGHDGCLGTLPFAMNACCGHGKTVDAYVQFKKGRTIRGFLARIYQLMFRGKGR